jgi:hypothetical protein
MMPLAKGVVQVDEELRRSFAQGIRLLLQAAQGLPVSGWEVSCRIAPRGISTERLLLGFNTQGVSALRLARLAGELGMPEGLAAEFQEDLASTAQVLLAVEGALHGLEIRAYQSFKDLERGMRGFKWLAQDPSKHRITEYSFEEKTWQSLLDFYYSRHSFYPHTAMDMSGPVMNAAAQIVRRSMDTQSVSARVEFFAVSETEGLRASSCFRLYETGLKFSDVQDLVSSLLSHYRLDAKWPHVQALMANRPLGWVAVGEDSLGIPFLTLYGEASVLDARRLMVFGAGK